MTTTRRSLFKAALAGAVSSCLRWLPMPKAPGELIGTPRGSLMQSHLGTPPFPLIPIHCCGHELVMPELKPGQGFTLTCPMCRATRMSGFMGKWSPNDIFADFGVASAQPIDPRLFYDDIIEPWLDSFDEF